MDKCVYPSWCKRAEEIAEKILAEEVDELAGIGLLHDGIQCVIDELSAVIVKFDPSDFPIVLVGLRHIVQLFEDKKRRTGHRTYRRADTRILFCRR